jgi:thymidylate kinase
MLATSAASGNAQSHVTKDVPIGPLVRRFFGLLDSAEVPWAVLRGAEGLPDFTRYDIDLLIRPGDEDRAEGVLRQAAAAEGWSVVRIVDKFGYRCCLLVSPGPVRRFLPIDFFGACHHRFYPIADGAYGLEARSLNGDGVAVVPPGFGAAVALLKELTRHPTFKENSREEVRAGALEDAESFRRGVSDVLGPQLTERLLSACQAGDWTGVERLVPEIRREVEGQRVWWSSDAIRFFTSNVRHHLKPPMSAFAVLLGPDGSGKSTIADRVADALHKQPFKVCPRYEYQFRVLPELKQLKRRVWRLLGRRIPEAVAVAPGTRGSGMNRDHPALLGMMYVSYYALDFLVGRLKLQVQRGQGGCVLFARYFHDYYYQLGYGKVPRVYLRLLERLAPRPDLMLYLHRDAEEIYAGKPELDPAEIIRQQQVIQALVAERSYAGVIDASKGVEETVRQVKERVLRSFLDRHDIS